MSVRFALLSVLMAGEGYGLELVGRMKERTKGKLNFSQSSVYPILRALNDEGLVTSWEGNPLPERGGRRRRYYKITNKGQRALRSDSYIVESLQEVPAATCKNEGSAMKKSRS